MGNKVNIRGVGRPITSGAVLWKGTRRQLIRGTVLVNRTRRTIPVDSGTRTLVLALHNGSAMVKVRSRKLDSGVHELETGSELNCSAGAGVFRNGVKVSGGTYTFRLYQDARLEEISAGVGSRLEITTA